MLWLPLVPIRLSVLRRCWLIRCVLVVWLAIVGGAVASPLLRPVGLEQVCSAMGPARWVGYQDGLLVGAVDHLLDCPLCMGTAAPPTGASVPSAPRQETENRQVLMDAAPWVWRAAAALPARGPPTTALGTAAFVMRVLQTL
ncbi:hypothetical protein GCM10027395_08710 [Giesbergeria sinuosa]